MINAIDGSASYTRLVASADGLGLAVKRVQLSGSRRSESCCKIAATAGASLTEQPVYSVCRYGL